VAVISVFYKLELFFSFAYYPYDINPNKLCSTI
jgi:hypothetical protein